MGAQPEQQDSGRSPLKIVSDAIKRLGLGTPIRSYIWESHSLLGLFSGTLSILSIPRCIPCHQLSIAYHLLGTHATNTLSVHKDVVLPDSSQK